MVTRRNKGEGRGEKGGVRAKSSPELGRFVDGGTRAEKELGSGEAARAGWKLGRRLFGEEKRNGGRGEKGRCRGGSYSHGGGWSWLWREWCHAGAARKACPRALWLWLGAWCQHGRGRGDVGEWAEPMEKRKPKI